MNDTPDVKKGKVRNNDIKRKAKTLEEVRIERYVDIYLLG
jgi:hypothetical protein